MVPGGKRRVPIERADNIRSYESGENQHSSKRRAGGVAPYEAKSSIARTVPVAR